MAPKRPTPAQQQKLVDQWNAKHPAEGVPILYWPGPHGTGDPNAGFTTGPAQMLGGHTATIFVDCASGCVALDHVEAGKVADSFSRFMSNTNGVQKTIAPLLALLKSIAESMDYTPPEARGRFQALAANVLNHIAHAFELTGR